MKRIKFLTSILTIAVTFFIAAISCKKIVYIPQEKSGVTDEQENVDEQEDEIPKPPQKVPVVYTSGIIYPDGYNWQKDSLYGNVECKLALFRNSEKIVEFPATSDYCACVAEDMHIIIDGALFTFCSKDGETFVGMNGKKLFSYTGKERLVGMVVHNGDLYTLGQGDFGFSYRKNGEQIIAIDNGYVLGELSDGYSPSGALYIDNNKVCFAFYKEQFKNSKTNRDYFTVVDGEVKELANFGLYKRIFDVKTINGKTHVLAISSSTYFVPTLFINGRQHMEGTPKIRVIPSHCQLLYNKDVHIILMFVLNSRTTSTLFINGEHVQNSPNDMTAICDNNTLLIIKRDAIGMSEYVIKQNVNSTSTENGSFALRKYNMFTPNRCFTLCNDKFYSAGLSTTIIPKNELFNSKHPFCLKNKVLSSKQVYKLAAKNNEKTKTILLQDGQEIFQLDLNGIPTSINVRMENAPEK